MQRNQKSIYNAISAILLTLCNGLFGLIVVKMILVHFGSDFNGLNSTASQLVTILMLLEGGFTIATNVALFKPYGNKDYDKVNAIISATRNTFRKIGVSSLIVGIALSIGYSLIVNTDLSRLLALAVLVMTILPVSFNFYFATKYRIILQAEQKEYVISFVTLFTTSLGYVINIIAMHMGCTMWFIRFTTMVFAIINSFIIVWYVRRNYLFLDLKQEPDYAAIKGTKDVFAQKLTGVFYSIAPIVVITVTAGGTVLASVYAVYNSVFILLKGILRAVIDAPRLGLGELVSEDEENVWEVFKQYQLIIILLLFAFLSTATVLIMPFINIYTKGITDANYKQPVIALLLVLICYFELIHIPSGHLLNMSGHFKKSKDFQIVSCLIMIIGIILTICFKLGVYGILSTVLLTAIVLCVFEIGFIHMIFFKGKLMSYFQLSLPILFISIFVIWIEMKYIPDLSGYFDFAIAGIVIFVVNLLVGFSICLAFNYKCTLQVYRRTLSVIKNR